MNVSDRTRLSRLDIQACERLVAVIRGKALLRRTLKQLQPLILIFIHALLTERQAIIGIDADLHGFLLTLVAQLRV